ncbi:MAG TPA: amidase [Aestuariivirgaceae bacterium]|jgi:aspartyl-tRNA(Asn)/glutamyl-tRNA(Gln) amidotransferase subunit A
MTTVEELARDLETGRATAAALVEIAMARIKDPAGEGKRTFLQVDEDGARERARHLDELRRRNKHPSRFAGIPISVKDLFDIAGEVTTAGSVVLKDRPPAQEDAPAIARLKAKGFIVVGRTNMTEFAYSGVGLNPHYGTPLSPYDRKRKCIPGGSSSGAAVSVADGMCALGIGTDTGGSCRIPAAFCGVTGYKPSTGRIPTLGAYPLSYTLDSVGSMTQSVQCAAIADAVMAGDWDGRIVPKPVQKLRLGLAQGFVEGVEQKVVGNFERALRKLGRAGTSIADVEFPSVEDIASINTKGGISAVEAYSHHKDLLAARGHQYDPRVGRRILNGAAIPAHEYVVILRKRADLVHRVRQLMNGFDGVVLPTTPNIPPPISALDADEDYMRINFLSLRNTFAGNFLDLCAISIPMHEAGDAPCGLMIMAPSGCDQALFATALAIEHVLTGT